MTKNKRHTPDLTIAALGESALIQSIQEWLGPANPPSPFGIGDDCALVAVENKRVLVTVDPVIRGRHFDETLAPRLVAEKLLKRNLSDIAAMGGTPTHAVIALSAPPDLSVAWIRAFYRGLGKLACRYHVQIVGGDCTQSDGFLGAYLTLLGKPGRRVLTREGAMAGDVLFVTGELGGSLLGRHARFTPRVDEGAWLSKQQGVHAAIDLSDGLGKDLAALVPSGLSADILTNGVPVSRDARRAARMDGRPLIDHVLNDGEDFELLFAVAAKHADALETAWRTTFDTRLTRIGELVSTANGGRAAVSFDPPLPPHVHAHGYEHFR